MTAQEVHEEKNTFQVDVFLPGHDPRTTTALFTSSKKKLLSKITQCFICGDNAEQAGLPLEAHHYPIERCFANAMDWELVKKDFPNFAWESFNVEDPYTFVDDMEVNGVLLCKKHHTGKDEGVHCLPHPIWIAQKYCKAGYKFSDVEVIHHSV